jgi:hypothetical protein
VFGHRGLEVGSAERALGVSRRALVRASVHWACSGEAQVCGQSQPGTAWVRPVLAWPDVVWARLGATLEVFHDDGSLAQGG